MLNLRMLPLNMSWKLGMTIPFKSDWLDQTVYLGNEFYPIFRLIEVGMMRGVKYSVCDLTISIPKYQNPPYIYTHTIKLEDLSPFFLFIGALLHLLLGSTFR